MIDEDHCVYVKRSYEKFIILSLYIDDILIAGNEKEYIMNIKNLKNFQCTQKLFFA